MLNPLDYSISKFITFTDANTLSVISDVAESVYFKKGALIETLGRPADHIFIIHKGLVQLGINGIDGSQFNLARLGPGQTTAIEPLSSERLLPINV